MNGPGNLLKLPPEAEGARDDGLRLVPLCTRSDHPSTMHYTELADIALRARSKRRKRKKS